MEEFPELHDSYIFNVLAPFLGENRSPTRRKAHQMDRHFVILMLFIQKTGFVYFYIFFVYFGVRKFDRRGI